MKNYTKEEVHNALIRGKQRFQHAVEKEEEPLKEWAITTLQLYIESGLTETYDKFLESRELVETFLEVMELNYPNGTYFTEQFNKGNFPTDSYFYKNYMLGLYSPKCSS